MNKHSKVYYYNTKSFCCFLLKWQQLNISPLRGMEKEHKRERETRTIALMVARQVLRSSSDECGVKKKEIHYLSASLFPIVLGIQKNLM